MTRRYKRQYEDEDNLYNFLAGIVIFYVVYLILEWYTNRSIFWHWLAYGVGIIILLLAGIYSWHKIKEKINQKKRSNIIDSIHRAGLEEYISNFISKLGHGQEKSKNVYIRRGYRIDKDQIEDLRKILAGKGVNFTTEELYTLLSHYIDEKEREYTLNSLTATSGYFSKLNGYSFEQLLRRLYEAMGYFVKVIGKTGDQGGDLIATRNQESILIQAKCYRDWSVGNSAIQQAFTAKTHYDCNKAIVITTSNFTREATEVAKTTFVELIPRALLQKMLLDYLKESWS